MVSCTLVRLFSVQLCSFQSIASFLRSLVSSEKAPGPSHSKLCPSSFLKEFKHHLRSSVKFTHHQVVTGEAFHLPSLPPSQILLPYPIARGRPITWTAATDPPVAPPPLSQTEPPKCKTDLVPFLSWLGWLPAALRMAGGTEVIVHMGFQALLHLVPLQPQFSPFTLDPEIAKLSHAFSPAGLLLPSCPELTITQDSQTESEPLPRPPGPLTHPIKARVVLHGICPLPVCFCGQAPGH